MPILSELQTQLNLFRRAHVGAARKASAAHALVEKIRTCVLWLPRNAALQAIACARYYRAGTDLSEQYADVADYQYELGQELDVLWPRAEREGTPSYAICPYFSMAPVPYSEHLGLGYLHCGASRSDLAALAGPAPCAAAVAASAAVSGASEEEMQALVTYHHAKALPIVAALRQLETALYYVRHDITGGYQARNGALRGVPDERLAGWVDELTKVVQMAFAPAPATHFSSSSWKTNALSSLPTTEAGLAPLLAQSGGISDCIPDGH